MSSVNVAKRGAWKRDRITLAERLAPYHRYFLLTPLGVLLLVFFVVPLFWLFRVSFYAHGGTSGFGVSSVTFYIPNTFTFDNYIKFFTDLYFLGIMSFTIQLAILVTAITMLLAYPFAYYIYKAKPLLKLVLLIIVILPKLSNLLVLIYGLEIILGRGGSINQVLLALGLVDAPLQLFHNLFGVVVGKVLLILPYTILVITATLHGLDPSLVDAARGMGGSPARTFVGVTLPLSLPGTMIALLITAIWALGAFVSPWILGTPDLHTLAVEVPKQTFSNVNWAMGSTVAFVMLSLVFVLVLIYNYVQHSQFRWRTGEATSEPDAKQRLGGKDLAEGRADQVTGALRFDERVIVQTALTGLPAARRRFHASSRLGLREGLLFASIISDKTVRRLGRVVFHLFAIGMVVYLLLPMVIAVLVSFSPTRFIEIPETFSLHWYRVFFNNLKWTNALWNSLYVGGLTIVISLAVGVTAALAFTRYKLKWGTVLYTMALTPVFTPAVIIGMSLLAFAHTVGIWGTYISIAIAHSLWSYPLVLMILKVSLEGLDPSLGEAAQGMGASSLRTFREITLPLIAPAVFVGVLFSFIISVNEFVMALFLSTVETETLPRIIWPTLRYALTPLVAAASGVLMLLTVAVLLLSARLMNLRKLVEFSRA